jgi:hypoxanthine phosphoribosyltransferase
VPARILRSVSLTCLEGIVGFNFPDRSFLKRPGSPNIPIQAIGLSLYESLGSDPVEEPGTKVTRTQWLDLSSLEMANLVGKNVLIVDEVDDTRTTLEYAVGELTKDVEEASQKLGRTGETTNFSIFVLHVCGREYCSQSAG